METMFITIAIVILIALARVALQWFCGQPLHAALTQQDNPAIGITMAGYLFGIMWTATVLLDTLSYDILPDIVHVLLYGCLGLLLLTAVALGSFRLYLGVNIQEQLAGHNIAAAIVMAAVYIATSLTYSGGLTGEGGGFWIMLLFFVLGQLALLGITYIFRWLTSYDDVQEIATGNTAAALALAGLLIAVALVVRRAVSGTYTGFPEALGGFLVALWLVVLLYPVRQVIVQWLLLGGPIHWRASLLDREIAQDKNIAAGLLEATAYITTALFTTYIT